MEKIEKWAMNGVEITSDKHTLKSVYDGDTFRLILPVCCKKYIFSCRLNRLDTPEIRTKNKEEKTVGLMVRDYVKGLLTDNIFRVSCGDFDKYGRVLCDIFVQIDGADVLLSDHLIEKGYAYRYDGGHKKTFDEWYKK